MRVINGLDLTGQVFGRLTVIEQVPKPEGSKDTSNFWLCRCSCGTEKIISAGNLRRKNGIRSCGCAGKEKNRERLRKTNRYDLSGEYGICYPYNTDDEILFDLEDYEKIKDYCWNIINHHTEGRKDYKNVHSMTYNCEKREHLFMHRFILGITDPEIKVDHINRNPLDNRKANLRICTVQQNNCNIEPKSHEYKGITVYKRKDGSERWVAQIQIDHVKHMLGSFDTKEQAALAYNVAAKKYHGEFAYLNDVHFDNEIDEIAN